jgi:hypothetical protein
MNIYASDEYYMPVKNIIYACNDICDLCEYLRLLEKKEKKFFAESSAFCSRRGPNTIGVQSFAESRRHGSRRRPPSPRAKYLALGEEPCFNESQIFGSRRRAHLQ